MATVEIDRLNCEIRLLYPTNESVKKLEEWQEEINNYPIKIIPQNTITIEQMKLLYVLFKQFSEGIEWYDLGYTKDYLKDMFSSIYEIGEFSLSPFKKNPLTLEQATEFIQFIIEFAIENSINLYIQDKNTRIKRHIREIVPDIQRYVIKCLRERVCCVCGEKHDFKNGKIVDLEHYDNISSTATTYKLDDGLQSRFLTLCRKHHIEIHSIPKIEFIKNYILEPVWLNEQLVYELLDTYPNHFALFRKRLKEGYYQGLIRKEKK
jgi:putative gp70|nr:MAG TPA: putative HNHc nuclease [Caudoviricetes sp.]